MKHVKICLIVLFLMAGLTAAALADDAAKDEEAIKKTVESYVDAFNKGDAQALASQWTDDGEYITPEGDVIAGHDKLKGLFEDFFKNNGGTKLVVSTLAIYLQSPDSAIEEGLATTTRGEEQPEATRYVASYVKQDGTWKISKIREIAEIGASPNSDKLKPLEWMIGDWIDQDQTGKLETNCYWSANNSFLVRSFSAEAGGLSVLGGKQIIAWDPASGKIRSWVFDSNGSFGEGTWSKDGDSWYVKSTITLNSGEKASSINILTPIDENSFTWRSIGREVAGTPLPSTPVVTVVRKQSKSATKASGDKGGAQ